MAEVTLNKVTKKYDETLAVRGIDLEIFDKEFVVLVGPSGCGKTTTLRMIAGLEDITDGEILIGGDVVNDMPPKDRDVAMVFQNYALYPHMTVRENMEFGLKIRKTPKETIDQMVNDAAKLLAIDHLLDRKPKQLSGGQRQRVALGRAIVRKPSVFLFDEPLSNLDAKLRVQMRGEIKKLQFRLQVTSIYVTHDQVEAMTMGNRIAVLNAGKVQQVGAPLELYERPQNLFVANFIGTPPMNFVKATVTDSGSELSARGFKLPAPASAREALAGRLGKQIVVGIRPEHVVGSGRQTRGAVAPLELTVDLVETLGDEVVIHGSQGGDQIAFKMDPHDPPQFGGKVSALVEIDRLHLFDAETEKRIAD